MQSFEFYTPTKFILGKDADLLCGREVKRYSDKVLFVHYGDDFTYRSGLHGRIMGALKEAGLTVFELSGVRPNPKAELVYTGIGTVRQEGIGCILAVGGGSVIDTAKAVGIGAKYDGDFWDFYTHKAVPQESLPVGVVMTLPATGSESSNGSVLDNGFLSADTMADCLRPAFTLMNPDLTLTIPKKQTICGIIDMFSHVMERYFSTSTEVDLTDYMCEGVMKSIISNSHKLMNNLQDPVIRAEFMWTSIVAHNGLLAVGRNQDWGTHALAAQLSAQYGTVHGAALSILFPHWAEYVLDESNVMRFAQFANRVFEVPFDYYDPMRTAREGIRQMRLFFDFLGGPQTLRDVGVETDELLRTLAERVCSNGMNGTVGFFRSLNVDDVEAIFRASF